MTMFKMHPCGNNAICYIYGLTIAGVIWALLVVAATLS